MDGCETGVAPKIYMHTYIHTSQLQMNLEKIGIEKKYYSYMNRPSLIQKPSDLTKSMDLIEAFGLRACINPGSRVR